MKHVGNTLYVTLDNAYLQKSGGSVVVRQEKKKVAQFPLIALGEIVCFGFGIGVSPKLAEHCAEEGITITYLSGSGRFLARMVGPTRGNVLLRREQYRAADDPERRLAIARHCVAGKIANQRGTLLRFARNHADDPARDHLVSTAERLDRIRKTVRGAKDLDVLRGMEGDAAEGYFSVFDGMLLVDDPGFRFVGRSRRPPRDRTNAMLSFAYSMLALDMRSSLESVGLDPYVGYLHAERPGRPALALDLMEEFRSPFADRLVVSLVNLRRVDSGGFTEGASGEVEMTAETRKVLLGAYQKRKREVLEHPFLEEEMELGVAFLVQARLMARHIRGDLDFYPPYLWR
jgi:CRISPR-associated protein Cas1